DPEHVEQNVEQPAVEVDRGEQGPPASKAPRDRSGGTQRPERVGARRKDLKEASRPEHRERVENQADHVERDARRRDGVGEVPATEECTEQPAEQIGRASCRERVEMWRYAV